MRHFAGDHMAFSLDIKAAYKRMIVKATEHGLRGFTLQGKLYFSRVAPFGGYFFSSMVGQDLAAGCFFFLHFWNWWAHTALLYVDDFLVYEVLTSMPLSATMMGLLCQINNIPASWSKCEWTSSLQWIIWNIHFRSGFIEIPTPKLQKILGLPTLYRPEHPNIQAPFGKTDWPSSWAAPAVVLHANLDPTLVS